MKNNKLIRFLKDFNAEDFKKFGVFLESPYYNKLKDIVRLYRAIKKYYPDFSARAMDSERLFRNIYPMEEFNYGRFRVLNSRMFTLAKKFIAVKDLESDPMRQIISVARNVRLLEDKNIFSEVILDAEMLLNREELKDEHYYYCKYELTYLKNISLGHFTGKIDYSEETYNLTIYYLASILKIYATWINSHNSINIPLDISLLERLENVITAEPYVSCPVIRINYNILLLAKDFSNEKYFFEHLKLTDKYPDAISRSDLYDTYVLLLNFCAIKNMGGDKSFNIHKFELYKKILSKNLFFINSETIPYEIYNNIITAALDAGDIQWAEKFITDYKDKLPDEYKNDIFLFCSARVCYFQNQYDKALENLSRLTNIENPFYKFAVKDLIIKTYYEMGYYENILSIIDSYKHLIVSSRLMSKDMRASRKDFLNLLNTFIKLKLNGDKNKEAEFIKKLENSKQFAQKEWLLEKAKESHDI